MIQLLLSILFPLLVALGAVSDALTMMIPNRLAMALVGGFFVSATLLGLDMTTVALHCAAATIVLAASFVLFARGWIGGGDAKFAAAIVLWLGWDHTFEFVVSAAILGGVLALAVMAFRGMVVPAFALRQEWVARIHEPKASIPFGIALAAAALLVYPHTIWMEIAIR